jgi:hypothetical protein
MPNVSNFPRFAESSNLAGHTFFKPSNYMSDDLKKIVSPSSIDLGLDDLLRKVMPNMPYDPSFIRNNGMLGLITQSEKAQAGTYNVNLGNIEKGRPVLSNSAEWTKDDWNQAPDRYEFMKKIMEKQSSNSYDPELIGLLGKVFKNRTTGFKRGLGVLGGMVGAGAGAGGTAAKDFIEDYRNRDNFEYQITKPDDRDRLKNIIRNGLIGAAGGGALGVGGGALLRSNIANKATAKALSELDTNYNSYFNTPNLQEMFPKNQFLEKTLLEAVKDKKEHSFISNLFGKKAEFFEKTAAQKKTKEPKLDQKNKKKLENSDEKSGISPYLLAGVPLTLASSLALKASLPAARMGLRQVLAKTKVRDYKPHEMVDDYLSASAGMKRSPLKPVMTYADSVSKGTPEEMIDEAIHWKEMTSGKQQGLDRWIHEVRRRMYPRKAQAFDRRVEHLKKTINNDPNRLDLAADDPISQGVLARLALHNAEPAKKFGLLGAVNTAGFVGGLGLTGKGVYDELQKESQSFFADENSSDGITKQETAKLLGGLGLGGLSIRDFIKAKKLVGSNTIAVSAGKLDKPVVGSSTGAGHVTPAEGLLEELIRHPAVTGGEFNIDKAIRTNQGKEIVWDRNPYPVGHPMREVHVPSNNHLVSVEHGFGGNLSSLSGAGSSPAWINPYGQALFVPDPPPKDLPFFVMHPHKNKGVIDYALRADQPIITFGGDDLSHHQGRRRLTTSPVAHPSLKDSVLNNAERALVEGKPEQEAVLSKLIEYAEKGGDTHSAEVLRNALKNKHKLLVVSGASRGDQVVSKSRALYEALKKRNLTDRYTVLALAAQAKNDDRIRQLIDQATGSNVPVASFGALPSDDYIAAQNTGDLHWGNTGANSVAEARAQATPVAFSGSNASEKAKELEALKRSGAPEKLLKEVRDVDLDSWNEGTINELKDLQEQIGEHSEGIKVVNTADELVDLAEKGVPNPETLKARASNYTAHARRAKRKLADKIIEFAREARKKSQRAANIHNIVGGTLLGGGLSMGASGLTELLKRKFKNKENVENYA